MCSSSFKELYLRELQNELDRPFKEGMNKEELAAFKEGIKKAFMAFKRLSGNREVIAVNFLLDEPLRRAVESEEL